MTKAFKKHLLITFLTAIFFGMVNSIFSGWERGSFWFAIVIIVNMLTWLGFKETFERENSDD